MEIFVVIPLAAGLCYALAAMALKKALLYHVGPWRVTFVANWLFMLATLPLLFFAEGEWSVSGVGMAAMCGVVFLLAQCLTFAAIQRGDVSVATPIMGSKILFVAVFWMLSGKEVTLWDGVSAVLAVLAIMLLQKGPRSSHGGSLWPTVMTSLGAAASFALCDVLIAKAAEFLDPARVMPVTSVICALLSFVLVPYFSDRLLGLRPPALWWLLVGAALIGLQSAAFGAAIVLSGDPTGCNVIYATRGMWAVLLVWLLSKHLGLSESSHSGGIFIIRGVGALLLFIAIVLQIFTKT